MQMYNMQMFGFPEANLLRATVKEENNPLLRASAVTWAPPPPPNLMIDPSAARFLSFFS
jgi:hypothetical protein